MLVVNWQQKFDARAKLKLVIEEALDIGLPRAYTATATSTRLLA